MENEPIWLSKLKELDISKILLKEFDGGSNYLFLKKRNNYINNLKNLDLIIIDKNDLNMFFHNSNYEITIGHLDELLIYMPEDEDCSKFSKIINRNNGIYQELGEVRLIEHVNGATFKNFDKNCNFRDNASNMYVLGENLAFKKYSAIKNIQEKDSKAIIFTYLIEEEVFIFFMSTYWEVKRKPLNLSFNQFLEQKGEVNSDTLFESNGTNFYPVEENIIVFSDRKEYVLPDVNEKDLFSIGNSRVRGLVDIIGWGKK